jgi:hypothetical protein
VTLTNREHTCSMQKNYKDLFPNTYLFVPVSRYYGKRNNDFLIYTMSTMLHGIVATLTADSAGGLASGHTPRRAGKPTSANCSEKY